MRRLFLVTVLVSVVLAAAAEDKKKPAPLTPQLRRLAEVRLIHIDSHTEYLKDETLENELSKKPEFAELGLALTRDPKTADLVVEVRRSNFQAKFPYRAFDARTKIVLTTGEFRSIGGSAGEKIARDLLKKIAAAREAVAREKAVPAVQATSTSAP